MVIGYNRKARGTVRERMDAQAAMNYIEPLLENATAQQMRSNKYRKLRVLYAYSVSFHFPASQAKPHLGVGNRNPMNFNRWGDDEFTDVFIFTKPEFLRMHDHVAPLINDIDDMGNNLEFIKAGNDVKVDTITAFAALLNRFRSRDKVEMTCKLFGEQIPTFSSVMVIALARLFPELEAYFDFSIFRAEPELMEEYIEAIDNKLEDPQYRQAYIWPTICLQRESSCSRSTTPCCSCS